MVIEKSHRNDLDSTPTIGLNASRSDLNESMDAMNMSSMTSAIFTISHHCSFLLQGRSICSGGASIGS